MPEAAERAAPGLIREVIQRFGFARIRVFGGSMLPAIRPGDVLLVRAAAAEEIAPGQVVLFERDGRLFAHRVVKRTGNGLFRTRGDSHWRADPPVGETEILGIVQGSWVQGSRFRFLVPGSMFKVGSGFRGALTPSNRLNAEPEP
jgi:signal peptidase I